MKLFLVKWVIGGDRRLFRLCNGAGTVIAYSRDTYASQRTEINGDDVVISAPVCRAGGMVVLTAACAAGGGWMLVGLRQVVLAGGGLARGRCCRAWSTCSSVGRAHARRSGLGMCYACSYRWSINV